MGVVAIVVVAVVVIEVVVASRNGVGVVIVLCVFACLCWLYVGLFVCLRVVCLFISLVGGVFVWLRCVCLFDCLLFCDSVTHFNPKITRKSTHLKHNHNNLTQYQLHAFQMQACI